MTITEDNKIIFESSICREDLLAKIQKRISEYNWTNVLLANNIDYKEFHIESDKIKIKRKPSYLTTYGQIDLSIEDTAEGKSILKFDLIPFNGLFPIIKFISILFGIGMTVVSLIISRSSFTLLIIALTWILVGLYIYLSPKLEKLIMAKYVELIIKDLI